MQRKSNGRTYGGWLLAAMMLGAMWVSSAWAEEKSATEKATAEKSAAAKPEEKAPAKEPAHEARMQWWREARFGMFVHWGIYSVPGRGEWVMQWDKIPVKDYEKFAAEFNPTKFDAKAWVKMAGDAGMRYLVITSKHHDGFCMWDSKVSDYDMMATPFKRDILAELANACKEDGRVRLCFYHSIMDWHHPEAQGLNKPGHYNSFDDKEYKPNPNFPHYFETYLKPQLKELVEKYDPAVMWFDGEWIPEYTVAMADELAAYMRELNPKMLFNNRISKSRKGMIGLSADAKAPGDFGTPENQIPGSKIEADWETCMTMNESWGYYESDKKWQSSTQLIHNLIDTSSKGGNLLLNVGPMPTGEIPEASVERLAEIGKWMKVNGEAIYGTKSSPFESKLAWGRATMRLGKQSEPTKIYLHVFEWPQDGQLIVPLRSPAIKAYLLGAK
ncbi:MAG: alpha-L-fucosidase, partial [Phycisphaerae bacterium]|nr:alpha-L-fucosidase [Phycisphaerae bacterium]